MMYKKIHQQFTHSPYQIFVAKIHQADLVPQKLFEIRNYKGILTTFPVVLFFEGNYPRPAQIPEGLAFYMHDLFGSLIYLLTRT